MKLSVIVPVYNAEQYLQQSIESVIGQTYKDLEVILVDDGSADSSGEICNQYVAAYDNIKVIHQKNSGNVAARCRGAEEATGEYVTFMDSDDWIAEHMYEKLMKAAEREACDIVSESGYIVYENGKYSQIEGATMLGTYKKGKNYDIFLSKMMYDEEKNYVGIGPSLSHKVIKRKVIVDVIKKIDKNIAVGGDAAIFYSSCLRAESICIIKGYQYFYRVHGISVSHSYDITYFNKIYTLYKYFQSDFSNFEEKNCLMEQAKKHIWNFLGIQMKHIFDLEIKNVYLFPYQSIKQGSNIILYGAGMVGRSYYEQIKKNRYCDIVAWADSKVYNEDENIISPSEIAGLRYSEIVIAVKDKGIVKQITNDLIALGVSKDKIVWEEPVRMSLI